LSFKHILIIQRTEALYFYKDAPESNHHHDSLKATLNGATSFVESDDTTFFKAPTWRLCSRSVSRPS